MYRPPPIPDSTAFDEDTRQYARGLSEQDPLAFRQWLADRVAQRRFASSLEHPGVASIGPLADPQWDGFFEALNVSAAGKPQRVRFDTTPIASQIMGPGLADDPAWWMHGAQQGPFGMRPDNLTAISDQVGDPAIAKRFRRAYLGLTQGA